MLGRLVDKGNTVLVIEHNLDVIKTADWIIDMGPEGGSRGGMVVAEGTPEDVAADPDSTPAQFLKPLLDGREASSRPQAAGAPKAPAAKAPATQAAKTAPAKTAAAKKAARKSASRRRR